jgi:catechol 2,3-dioxygenase-like lactoylglutathione lyase family enzyme
MLKDRNSAAIVAVSDIERARHFYADTLGLELVENDIEGVLGFRTGETGLVVYCSKEAGTNRANAVVWSAGDEIDAIVADLRPKASPSSTTRKWVASAWKATCMSRAPEMVWFKDPDGNILHLNNM